MKISKSILRFTLLALFFTGLSYGQTNEEAPESDEAALAKATQNPLAAMYSLPFQNNTTFGVGEYDRTQNVLNIQPVIPIGLGEKFFNFSRRRQRQFLFHLHCQNFKSFKGPQFV